MLGVVEAGTPIPSELTEVLIAALEQTRSAACITDAELDAPGPRILYVNPAYCRMTGHVREEVIGLTPRLMQGALTDRGELDRLRNELGAGRPFTGETVNYRKDGTPFIISWSVDPVREESGEVAFFVATQEDVTRLRRAEALIEATQSIDAAVNSILSSAVEGSVRGESDLTTALGEEIVRAVTRFIGAGRVALRIPTPAGDIDVFSDTDEVDALDAVARSRRDGQNDVLRTESWIGRVIPTRRAAAEAVLAITGLSRHEMDFVDDEGLDGVIERSSAALEALSEYQQQRNTALALQQDLLPHNLDIRGVDLAVHYQPGTDRLLVGGDWYDAFEVGGWTFFILGDVAGSGIGAAATMGRLRLLTRALIGELQNVQAAMGVIDRICADEGLFATVVVVELDTASGNATVTSAGHPPPIMRWGSGPAVVFDLEPGPPLGTGSSRAYQGTRTHMGPGDLTILYSDGAIERRGEVIDVGLRRLVECVESAGPGPDVVCAAVLAGVNTDTGDDLALLAFHRPAPGARRGADRRSSI
jgi:PAS domain S-box-containing protein